MSAPGAVTFSPAYIDAIDPASGRGMRYSSQPLRVQAGAAAPIDSVTREAAHLAQELVLAAIAVVVAIFGGAYLIARLVRHRRTPPVAGSAPPPPSAAAAPPAARDPLHDAFDRFRAQGDDASLDALRSVLFTRAGAKPGATFADALRALGGRDPDLSRILAVAERARFGPAYERSPAAHDLIALLDAYASAEPVA